MATDARDETAGRYAVLDVFGLKLEVSNPRIAELLTMDAREFVTTDVRDLASPRAVLDLRDEMAQAVPDALIAPVTPRDEHDAAARAAFRERTAAAGAALGFDTRADGMWASPTGLLIVTRAIERPVSFAAASHFVAQIVEHGTGETTGDTSILFVTESQQSADVFKVAIRQRRLHDQMRVVSAENLEAVAALYAEGQLDHSKAVVLLSPIADVDVGEILSVIRSSSIPGEIED